MTTQCEDRWSNSFADLRPIFQMNPSYYEAPGSDVEFSYLLRRLRAIHIFLYPIEPTNGLLRIQPGTTLVNYALSVARQSQRTPAFILPYLA